MATKPRLTGIIDRATIAALRALDIQHQDNDKAYVVGVGLFDFDLSSNAADNSSTVIKPDTIAPGDPGRWVKAAGGASEIVTTSITPVVYDGSAYVPAQADAAANCADLVLLSDGSRIESGEVTWTAHGLQVGFYYFLSQTVPGSITPTPPESGLVQRVLFVEDANTVHVSVKRVGIGAPSGSLTDWQPFVFNGGWQNLPPQVNPRNPCQYRKDPTGKIVYLRGYAINGGTGDANYITELPVGFRPQYVNEFRLLGDPDDLRLYLNQQGRLIVAGGTSSLACLDGLFFFVD